MTKEEIELLDKFAGLAMQSFLSDERYRQEHSSDDLCRMAYYYALTMLDAKNNVLKNNY